MFFSRLTARQILLVLLITSIGIRLMMAMLIPVTGDEAYFIFWATQPDYGYYDHPPMVGWWLTALMQFGDHPLWLRMPTILITTLIGVVIYILVRPIGAKEALMACGLYWLAPVNLVVPLITTDTPLIFWSFLSAYSFYRAQQQDHYGWYLLAGLFLGLAFFSKFFAGLLGVAYFIYLMVFARRGVRPYIGLLLIILGTLPFIGLNLLWNYNHCWNNYLFNLQNRTSDYAFSPWLISKYLLLLLYLVTPPVFYFMVRHVGRIGEILKQRDTGVFLGLFLIPILLFIVVSTGKSVGLHWLLSFYPFLFIALPVLLTYRQLRISYYFMWVYGLLHVVGFVILINMLPGLFRDDDTTYKELVYTINTQQMLKAVNPLRQQATLATPSYSESALLSYHAREHVIVFSVGSHHGRQDDLTTDFRELDGKQIAIISFSEKDLANYEKYFASFEMHVFTVEDARFVLGVGSGFLYEKYNREVLEDIRKRFYRIPGWLPVGECYMHERQ